MCIFHIGFRRDRCLLAALAFCLISSAAASVNPVVNGDAFVVSGATSRPAIANAQIEIRVGSSLFTGTANNWGQFSIEVTCPASPDELVYVIARGVESQSNLEMARVLDSCGNLQAQAGPQGQYRTGPVNPISTGMYAAMRWFAEREDSVSWPMTASELIAAQYLIGGSRVATAAQAVGYWEAGLGTAPPGIDTSLELVLDRSALSVYVSDIVWNEERSLLDNIARQVFWDPRQLRRPSEWEGNELASVCTELQQSCGEWFRFNANGSLEFVNRFDASSGEWLDLSQQDQLLADAFEQRFSSLRTLLASPTPSPFLWRNEVPSQVLLPDFSLVSTIRRTEATKARVKIVGASDLISLLGVQYDTVRSFPEFPEIPAVETRDALPQLYGTILDFDQRPNWAGPQVGEEWILPLLLPDVTPGFSPLTAARVQFQSEGNAVLPASARELEWTFDNQTLTLNSPDLGQQQLYFLGQAENRHPIFFVKAEPDEDSNRRIETSAGFQPSPDAGAWQPEHVAGRYVSGFGIDNWITTELIFSAPYFVFDLNADGSGRVGEVPAPDAPLESGGEVSWSIDPQGGLVLRRKFSEDFDQWRRWERLSEPQTSDILYVRESTPLFIETENDNAPQFLDYRVNFYQLREMSEP